MGKIKIMRIVVSLIIFCIFLALPLFAADKTITDAEVRQLTIEESISSYPGNCPCPYNRASNGSRCGKRSAWSRAGGYSPLCYESDVSDEMVESYRSKHGLIKPAQ